MMYEDVVADFAQRARRNLRAVESLRAEGREVFEVTQLVNSMLGLLVFPTRGLRGKNPEDSSGGSQDTGVACSQDAPGFAQAADLAELVRYLRNAISHFNIEFIGDGQNQIRLVRVWNKDRNGTKTWEANLGLDELRGIAERFTESSPREVERQAGCLTSK